MLDLVLSVASFCTHRQACLVLFVLLSPLVSASMVAFGGRSFFPRRYTSLLSVTGILLSFVSAALLLAAIFHTRMEKQTAGLPMIYERQVAAFIDVPYFMAIDQNSLSKSAQSQAGSYDSSAADDNVLHLQHHDGQHSALALVPQSRTGWSIKLDMFSGLMLVMVTLVSLMVHIYSAGYFHKDQLVYRFMSYLSYFTFFMLLLILSPNPLMMFVGWEGVGLCSYLLIGYQFQNEKATKASYKAFIVNRVGDCCFVIALVLYCYLSRYSTTAINEANLGPVVRLFGLHCNALKLMSILFALAAMTKSAQIFLHVWLPDAMEGPTPASALIHSATMVTAGVVLLLRLQDMLPAIQFVAFSYKTFALCMGIATAVFCALMAVTRFDIKRIIAYSTCSQLGLMFVAFGSGSSTAALFHLLTHAFFKSLLFLGAGVVIHVMHGEQDIRHLQGIRHKTSSYLLLMFLLGGAALSGLFPFAGFYSKDLIFVSIYNLYTNNGSFLEMIVSCIALAGFFLVSFLTPLYIFRMIFKVFLGKTSATMAAKTASQELLHRHAISKLMLAPMSCLAALSVVGGYVGHYFLERPKFMMLSDWPDNNIAGISLPSWCHLLLYTIPVLGVVVAYFQHAGVVDQKSASNCFMGKFLQQEGFFNQIYELLFIAPLSCLAKYAANLDCAVVSSIDRALSGIKYVGLQVNRWKTGYCYHDVWNVTFGGVVLLLLALVSVS